MVSAFDEFTPNHKIILWALFLAFILSSAFRVIYFMTFKSIIKSGNQKKRILIIGSGKMAQKAMLQIESMHDFGYRLHGILSDKYDHLFTSDNYLGSLEKFREIVGSGNIDEVVIALSLREEEIITSMVDKCEQEGVRVRIAPDFFSILRNRAVMEHIGELPLIAIRPEPLSGAMRNRFLKRFFDMAFAFVIMVISAPFFILIAIAIKIGSPGPVIFKQKRIGINNIEFDMYKFRSMTIVPENESDTLWITDHGKRVTAIGQFLRRTNLDELPQFWNVLAGNMSVVGPRPERKHFVEKFRNDIPHYKVRHLVKSGITGLAQVNGLRGDTSIKKRIEYDIYYLENWSFWLDLKIIWLTVFGNDVDTNAY
jgi:Undecaprenyl-phosphate glucose phosphotransferase